MLNSNYFSKRAFSLTIKVFHLWLEQQYNISCSNDVVFTQQVHFYNSYIKYINYRQKYIQDRKKKAKDKLQNQSLILNQIEKELLNDINITSYSSFIKK